MLIEGADNGKKANVTDENELVVRAVEEPRIVTASREERSFSWDSTEQDIDATDTMLFVRNDDDAALILDRAVINGSDVICEWTIHRGNAITTPTGTAIAGVSMIGNTGLSDRATASYDEEAVADGDVVGRAKTPVDNSIPYNLAGMILKKGQYIQFNQETESDSGSVILYGHFDK